MSKIYTFTTLKKDEEKVNKSQGRLVAQSVFGTLDNSIVNAYVERVDKERLSADLRLVDKLPEEIVPHVLREMVVQSHIHKAVDDENLDTITRLNEECTAKDSLEKQAKTPTKQLSPSDIDKIEKRIERNKLIPRRGLSQLEALQLRVRKEWQQL